MEADPLIRLREIAVSEARRLGAAHDAEDLAQEAVIRTLGRSMDAPGAYIRRVVRGLLAERALDADRSRELASILARDQPAARGPSANVANGFLVQEILEGLTERDRELVWRRRVLEQPAADVAQTMGYASGAVVDTTLKRITRRIHTEFASGCG